MAINPGFAALMVLTATLCGCASQPPALDTSSVNSQVVPQNALSDPSPPPGGRVVHWGGQIVSIDNRADSTQLQILSYPLGRNGRPLLASEPTGRFVLIYPGFLEPEDFRPGKLVSAVGKISGESRAVIGAVELVLPTVTTDQLRLWRKRESGRVSPQIGIGIGISL